MISPDFTLKKTRKSKPKVPAPFPQERKNLIIRLLKDSPRPINWMIEGVIVKRLFSYYPFPEFWNQFEVPAFLSGLDSLKVFAGQWGLSYIQKSFNLFLFEQESKKNSEQQKEINLEDKKIGEDLKINKKKTTLLDFLN